MAVLGRPVRVAVVAAEEALHPLLLGAPGGRAPGPLGLGELEGVEAAPDRLAVDLVLGGEVGQTRAGANRLTSGDNSNDRWRDSSRDSSRDASSGPRDIT